MIARLRALVRLAGCLALWPPAYALLAALWVLGWLIVPALTWLDLVECRRSEIVANHRILAWRPQWAWFWSNEEDGVRGPITSSSSSTRRWLKAMIGKPEWYRRIAWSCWRNPVGNERFSRLGVRMNPRRLVWVGNSAHPWLDYLRHGGTRWLLARQGWRAGFWLVVPRGPGLHARLRLGWKIVPGAEREIDHYCGLALQASLKRKD